MTTDGPHLPTDPEASEAELWDALKTRGSSRAREGLFARYLPLARQIANRHFLDRGGDIEFPDLCQLAYAGLLEAIDHFDPGFGTSFARYAERRIAGSVLDGIGKTSEVREQISFRNRVRDERARSLSVERAADLSPADAMDALVEAAIGLAIGFMFEGTNLYVPGEAADRQPDAYESLAWKEAIRKILNEVSNLPVREKFVIQQHYIHGLSFENVAKLLNLTKGRISQIHHAGLALLKQRLSQTAEFKLEQ